MLLWVCPCLLGAQQSPEASATPTVTQVAVGAYAASLSEGQGTWKGWTLDATGYPEQGGIWWLSATGFDRPEGRGTLLGVGKEWFMGAASSLYLGLRAGTQAPYLPRWGGDLDLRLDLAAGWKLDAGLSLNQYDGSENTLTTRLGPAYVAQGWSASAVWQCRSYPQQDVREEAGILDVRLGLNDLGTWHALRLAAGRGILESLAAGGGSSSFGPTTSGGSGAGLGRRQGQGTTTASSNPAAVILPSSGTERFISATGHWPLPGALALKVEAFWGDATSYQIRGGSLQVCVTF